MEKTKKSKGRSFKAVFSALVIPVSLIIGILVFVFIMGDGSHFQGGDNKNNPLPGDYFGTVYKGGMIVPILMCLLLTVIIFVIERYLTISKAAGKGALPNFMQKIKSYLAANDITAASQECDRQKGSVANVIKSCLIKYKDVEGDINMVKEQKLVSIQKEVEESTSLELPSLEQNLNILATIASISTLLGLLGTVLGMIRAFAALAHAGAPDSVALATGISEALINTAFGIGTSALAIIFYNMFTSKIDKLTYSIDEAGFSIVQTYAANHK
jgi:biopolymer transport protein ExbB